MGEVIGLGRRRPDGTRIVTLRKQKGVKQEDLARKAGMSVRTLRDVERSNHPIPATTITAIATELKVSPDQITLANPDDLQDDQRLKLRAMRSAVQLSNLADEAHRCVWGLEVAPSAATAKEMQQFLNDIRRLVEWSRVSDEFDNDGYVTRVARLQASLDALRAGDVGVIAGNYYKNTVISGNYYEKTVEERIKILGTKCPINNDQIWIRLCTLEMRFVPSHFDEKVIEIDTGLPSEHIDELLHNAGWTHQDFDALKSLLEGRKTHVVERTAKRRTFRDCLGSEEIARPKSALTQERHKDECD
jgi:transcriptional regulator with XRE-family HTH domain